MNIEQQIAWLKTIINDFGGSFEVEDFEAIEAIMLSLHRLDGLEK